MTTRIALSLGWGLALAWAVAAGNPANAGETQLNGHTFTLPEGFSIELAAGADLVERPIAAAFDDEGRLYVAESSGTNDPVEKQLADKPHRILRLEDTDEDGRYDRRTVFADHMMLPQGAMWLDGSLYVAAPPSIWKLTDTNDDGVADQRVEWYEGKTLTGCANDLHGPYLGPDGWIYWCKGGFAEQTYPRAGKPPLVSRAAHILRARPDGSDLEVVMTGGMDNPVEIVWTPEGELIFTATFVQHPAGGRRDGLVHNMYGAVYGKEHAVLSGHFRSSPDTAPIMTHLGPAAPCGLVRYESMGFGPDYQDNLFACLFNMHKVTRHKLFPLGVTFRTRDSDFLVSDNLDFHPTDVLEDADGSLLVIDTGGWYKLCCPTSQLAKPDVLGAIYRVRKAEEGPELFDPLSGDRVQGANPTDPRGRNIKWVPPANSTGRRHRPAKAGEVTLLEGLLDERPAVARKAAELFLRRRELPQALGVDGLVYRFNPYRNLPNVVRVPWVLSQSKWHPEAKEKLREFARVGRGSSQVAAIRAAAWNRDANLASHFARAHATSDWFEDASPLLATVELLGRRQDGGNAT